MVDFSGRNLWLKQSNHWTEVQIAEQAEQGRATTPPNVPCSGLKPLETMKIYRMLVTYQRSTTFTLLAAMQH